MKPKYALRAPIILIPGVIFIFLVVIGFVDSAGFIATLTKAFEVMMYNMGWFVSLAMLFFILFVAVVIFHPVGRIRLGGPNAKPKMSYWQWFGVSLTTGIGAGVVFWGAAEPLIFAMEPAPSFGYVPGSNEAILWGMRTVFLHWTLTPYASCVAFGVVLAYVCHNMKLPYKVSSGLVPVFGRKFLTSKWALAVDVLTVFALVGAVSGGLGYGVLQLSQGVNLATGIQPSSAVYISLGIALFAAYMSTGISGLKKGITWLGDKNTQFYFILLGFMLLVGPIGYTLNLMTQSLGAYLSNLLEAMTYTSPFPNGELWPQWWDMYWWVDWLAYGPMLGLFFVRMGYGRPLREFVVVNWLMPAVFGFVWFSIFGGTVLHGQFFEGIDYYSIYQASGAEALTLAVFGNMPLSTIMKAFMLLIIAISLVTQANSMVGTLSSMSLKEASESEEPPAGIKFFWGILLMAVALVFTLSGGIEGIKIVKSFCGMPITFLAVIMLVGFIKYMMKRPRTVSRDYVYEDVIRDAPDSGEEAVPPSKTMEKLAGLFKHR